MVRTVLATSNKHSAAKLINDREVENRVVGERWLSNKLTEFALELGNTYPSAKSWKPATIAYGEDAEMDDFSSYHMTGTQFVFADGSVRWIAEDINLSVYHALATRAGGEVVGSDF